MTPEAASASSSASDSALTPEDVTLIRKSWLVAAAQEEVITRAFYDRLFATAPATRRLFRNDLKLQRRKLGDAMAAVVDGLDHPEELIEMVSALGRRHSAYGVRADYYPPMREALLWALRQNLAPIFDARTEAAWSRALALLSEIMIAAQNRRR